MIKNKSIIEGIETLIGNDMIEDLIKNDWKVKDKYSDSMIDKGIDYDYYVLKNGRNKIRLDWDNWSEWKLSGPQELLDELKVKYKL